jgi:hypothetical protein
MVIIFGYAKEAASRTKNSKSGKGLHGPSFANYPTHGMHLIVMSELLENEK